MARVSSNGKRTAIVVPEGSRIAFQSTRSGPIEIRVMGADGNDARPITR